MVLDISDDESVNSTFRNEKKRQDQNDRPKIKFKYESKFCNWEFLTFIDYKLVHDSEIQNNASNRLNEIHRKLVVTYRKLNM